MIREALPSDGEAVAVLCEELGYAVSSGDAAGRLARLAADEEHAVLVAESRAEGVVGCIHVLVREGLLAAPDTVIGALVVTAAMRGRGVGTTLLQAAEAWAREHGLEVAQVRSRVERPEAHAFYQRQGYRVTKTQLLFRRELAP